MTVKLRKNISTGGLIGKTLERSSECHLWRAVISQAISDAYLDDVREKDAVAYWITTADFVSVCDLADIEWQAMQENLNHILSASSAVARYEGRKLKDLIDKNSI